MGIPEENYDRERRALGRYAAALAGVEPAPPMWKAEFAEIEKGKRQ